MLTSRPLIRPFLLLAGAAAMLSSPGCAGKKAAERPAPLNAADFASAAAAAETGDPAVNDESAQPRIERRASLLDPEVSQVRVIDEEQATEGLDDVAVLTGPPPTLPREPADSELGVIAEAAGARAAQDPTPVNPASLDTEMLTSLPIDAMVGHINGRPLFASDFFEPMDARMRVEAARMSERQWLQFAQDQIRRALRDRIRDELLLAELEASLSAQERVGLLAFVGQLRENLLSENYGSAQIANRRLLEEEGVTLDEKILQERNRELIRMQLRRAIAGKTIVSWRDVRQAYERDIDKYNPPPEAHFRVVWTLPNSPEIAERIEADLASGRPFAEIAADSTLNSYQIAVAGETVVTVSPEGWSESTFFGPPELNNAALALEIGQVAGPIDFAGRKVWLTLEQIEDKSVSLYDAQLAIYEDILSDRFTEAQAEYFSMLISRGSLSDIEQMERRLFELAADRYLLAAARMR